ncbi:MULTISPECIES: helix-turn-helix domain-containing protein [unclassified Nitrospina]|uniref:helix-turn-helix domain-containing protein n=1 Tax=unclassified Nitrospina TaxID=2638683 RepID=UPI003F9DB37A
MSKKHKKNPHLGSTLDALLEEDGTLDAANTLALKRVFAYQLEQTMKEKGLKKPELSQRMHTSRAALDRLLDPENPSVTLNTLNRAASAVGKKLKLELVDS